MPQHKRSYVYTLANHSRSIYVGNTSNLEKQVWQYRLDLGAIHTSRFNISRLVWFEQSDDIRVAISREKQIKN
ncbi:MAG: GIY-YIG nuclease family protein [Dehalococcoidia bacterium]